MVLSYEAVLATLDPNIQPLIGHLLRAMDKGDTRIYPKVPMMTNNQRYKVMHRANSLLLIQNPFSSKEKELPSVSISVWGASVLISARYKYLNIVYLSRWTSD